MISIKDLSFSQKLRDGKHQCIINGIHCSVERGACVTIIGPSGGGKTTLLRILAGLEHDYEGAVDIDGASPLRAQEEGRIGFVFQQPVLFPWRTVRENIELPFEVKGKSLASNVIGEMLKITALEKYASYHPYQLSGGMQSRVAIARALVTEPDLLLLDEPFADLDEFNRERMNLELQRIWMNTGATMFFVTHDLVEAVFLADRVIVLSSKPAQIYQEFQVNFPRPRTPELMECPEFDSLLLRVRGSLRKATKLHAQQENCL
ncbi:MAG: ABC transporter ATP-binding protein [Desulfobulbaceae bacterium]|nr:MAG: ABC transporter ATP-binding protein [Desulfobulbaceae bacterium]